MSGMNVELKEYEPIGHHVLVELDVKATTDSGIILDKKKADKWMRVAKIGSLVTAVEIGDLVVMGEPRGLIHLQFGNVQYMQVYEHDLAGKVPAKNVKLNGLKLDTA